MSDSEKKQKRLYCNWCKSATNHQLDGEHRGYFDDGYLSETLIYRLWVCMGCEHGVLEQEYSSSLDPEDEYEYFPRRAPDVIAPKSYSKLKAHLVAIYKEAITCYNAKALILAGAGLRALLEGVCQDKRIRGRNLKERIDGLRTHLPNANIIRNLHQFRFMGNTAVHELAAPKAAEVKLAISVIEDLLNFFYEMDYKASRLRQMRAQRKSVAAKPKRIAATLQADATLRAAPKVSNGDATSAESGK